MLQLRFLTPTPTHIMSNMAIIKSIILTYRFEALAATGNHSAELAMSWLVRHVNDPRFILPDCELPICCNDVPPEDTRREYCLTLCPSGRLLADIREYYVNMDAFGFNEAHNCIPHMKLTPFFKVIYTIAKSFTTKQSDSSYSMLCCI